MLWLCNTYTINTVYISLQIYLALLALRCMGHNTRIHSVLCMRETSQTLVGQDT